MVAPCGSSRVCTMMHAWPAVAWTLILAIFLANVASANCEESSSTLTRRMLGVGDSSWPVVCSKQCKGIDTCQQVCKGEQTQFERCPPENPCPKPQDDKTKCPHGPQPCVWSDWSSWKNDTQCTGLCVRTRKISSLNRCGGSPCKGPLEETKQCPGSCSNIQRQDCAFSTWTLWSQCGMPTPFQKHRSRKIKTLPSQGGDCLQQPMNETATCGTGITSTDCQITPWMDWTSCDRSCGSGQKNRFRSAMTPMQGGKPCFNLPVETTAPCNTQPCGVRSDCILSIWSTWIGCTIPTGLLEKVRTRQVLQAANYGGKHCKGSLQEMAPCPDALKASAAVDCVFTTWQTWSVCDRTCGWGQASRQRTVGSLAKNGGVACIGNVKETKECQVKSCPEPHPELNCNMTRWSDWSKCSATCGVGSQRRERTIKDAAKMGGKACTGSLLMLRECQGNPKCSIKDCRWGDWEDWSNGTATCGLGTQRRTRRIIENATPQGKVCSPHDAAHIRQIYVKCPKQCVDGVWGHWQKWSGCTKSCSGGYRYKTRSIEKTANYCGKAAAGFAVQTESCNDQIQCKGDENCKLADWAPWGACSKTCGGVRERRRAISVHGSGHGKYCGTNTTGLPLSESRPCSRHYGAKCPLSKKKDCELGSWRPWSSCSRTCDGGYAERVRDITQPSRTGVPCIAILREVRTCNRKVTCGQATDCKWGAWSDWGGCTKCSGEQFRSRKIDTLPVGEGKTCDASAIQEVKKCAKNCGHIATYFCIWASWSDWSRCDNPCGNGTRTRNMVLGGVQTPVADYAALAHSEDDCVGRKIESETCDAGSCKTCQPRNCTLGGWGQWSSPTCDGICTRNRTITQQANSCGAPCTGPMRDTKPCVSNSNTCSATNCQFASWGTWTACHDILGQKFRQRSIDRYASNNGKPCVDHTKETAPCLTNKDVVNCKLATWGAWGNCSEKCGGGQKQRKRTIQNQARHGGQGCDGGLEETAPCNEHKCAPKQNKDCVLSTWGVWSGCNSSVDVQAFRWRHVKAPSTGRGRPCAGALQETHSCMFPVDCKFSGWTGWTKCSATCQGGQQQRSRSVLRQSEWGGKSCFGDMITMRPCNEDVECLPPRDCKMMDWMTWTACEPPCGRGQKERRRDVMHGPARGGKDCPKVVHEILACESKACAGSVDCKWETWHDWMPCVPADGPCGVGYKRRVRGIEATPVGAGRQCPPRIKDEVVPVPNCHNQWECCRDAKWGEWEPWSQCSTTCGGGTRKQIRLLEVKETWCGKPAVGSNSKIESCNSQKCPRADCQFSMWSAWFPPKACSGPCVEGHQERTRQIAADAHAGGTSCTGSTHEWKRCPFAATCNESHPPSQDCVLGIWTAWSACSRTCHGGYMFRNRNVSIPPKYGGKPCPENVLRELRPCNSALACGGASPGDCVWNDWIPWLPCDQNNSQFSTRGYQPAINGGVPCAGASVKVRMCGTCANNTYSCGWGKWDDWSDCSRTCGSGGTRKRTRHLQASIDPIMDKLFEDSPSMLHGADSEKSLGTHAEPRKSDSRRTYEWLSAVSIGFLSLSLAFVARSMWRRSSSRTNIYVAVASHELVEEGDDAME